jgi:soluble lytic murein transglycosylase
LLFCALLFGAWVYWQYWREHRYDREIATAAGRYQISPALVKAVVWQESRFNANVRGGAGEIGLMQIREAAAQEWADAEHLKNFHHESIFDPGRNTLAGAWYLSKLLRRYQHTDNPLPFALADYNAGRGNVLKWNHGAAATNSAAFIEEIRFPGTKQYVRSVMKKYEDLKASYP